MEMPFYGVASILCFDFVVARVASGKHLHAISVHFVGSTHHLLAHIDSRDFHFVVVVVGLVVVGVMLVGSVLFAMGVVGAVAFMLVGRVLLVRLLLVVLLLIGALSVCVRYLVSGCRRQVCVRSRWHR